MNQDAPTKADITRLWREYKAEGSQKAKDTIVVHYLRLVQIVAGRMAMNSPSHVEKDDLIGWGVLGLLDAVDKYDPDQNVTFETYASTRIRGSIIDQIRALDWAPRSLRRKARRMKQAEAKLKAELGREPTRTEVASEMEITEAELFDLETEIHGAYVLSLDARISPDSPGGEEATLGRLTSGAAGPSPEESILRKEMEESLLKAIEKLSVTERNVITLYYYDELTLKEIGKVLALSESRICQIHRAVTKKLREHLGSSFRDAAS